MPSFQKPSFGQPRSAGSAGKPGGKLDNAGGMSRDAAESIACSALVFVAEDPGRLSRFLDETGLAPADLATSAGSPHMLVAVLDHLMSDESLLLTFSAHAILEPTAIARSQYVLATSA